MHGPKKDKAVLVRFEPELSRAAGHASVRTTEVHYVRAALWEGRLTASATLAALRVGATKALDDAETEEVN
jgi:hypothetical protein